MRAYVLGSVCRPGGSISRPWEVLYREAADVAYYLHWGRGEIMEMNKQERRLWLEQISRIQRTEQAYRQREWLEQIASLQQGQEAHT